MLQIQGPVPDVGSGDLAVHAHDGAGIRVAIKGAGAYVGPEYGNAAIPLREEGWNCQVAGRDRASGKDRCCRNIGETKRVVEGEEGFPIDRFINQSSSAPDHSVSLARDVPGKAEAWGEVLVIGIV